MSKHGRREREVLSDRMGPMVDGQMAEDPLDQARKMEFAPVERLWRGCVMIREGTSWRWAEVTLPESVVQDRAKAIHTPDLKQMVVGHIENVFLSEAMVTGRGWEPKR